MSSPLYIAVDLGAGSGRVFLAGFHPDAFLLEEIHRFRYPPYSDGRYLRWNFSSIFDEILTGLRLAGDRARELGCTVETVGVDTWGVDYGLVGADGHLVCDPVCYRDGRTDNVMSQVFSVVPADEIFDRTGIQFQKFNTLYQLYSESEAEKASMLLLLPDLINYKLTGRAVTEYTNATTTQMVNAGSRNWDSDLLGPLSLPGQLLQQVVPTGTRLGGLRPEIIEKTGLDGVAVVLPGTHDTASAVAAAPLAKGSAYISSGTWSLIGVELERPLKTREAARLNFTNEGGVYDTFRFLRNVMGLWIFESCRKEWEADGDPIDYGSLIGDVAAIDGFPAFIYPDDECFLNPVSMLDAINAQLSKSGAQNVDGRAVITKIIFDSLAFRYASVLRSIEALTGRQIERIEILGGGGRNRYLNQMTANATGLPVRSGMTEATVVGNVLVQAIESGRFNSLSEARAYAASMIDLENYAPQSVSGLADAAARYQAVETRYSNAVARAGDGI